MPCAFFLDIEGDLDVHVNKLILFPVLFILFVAWDGFAGKARSNLKKGGKSEVWVVI